MNVPNANEKPVTVLRSSDGLGELIAVKTKKPWGKPIQPIEIHSIMKSPTPRTDNHETEDGYVEAAFARTLEMELNRMTDAYHNMRDFANANGLNTATQNPPNV